jgi:hypothetical protein
MGAITPLPLLANNAFNKGALIFTGRYPGSLVSRFNTIRTAVNAILAIIDTDTLNLGSHAAVAGPGEYYGEGPYMKFSATEGLQVDEFQIQDQHNGDMILIQYDSAGGAHGVANFTATPAP